MFDRALDMFTSLYGKYHKSISTILEKLAIILRNQGKVQQALEFVDRAHHVAAYEFGAHHTDGQAVLGSFNEVWEAQSELPANLEKTKSVVELAATALATMAASAINFDATNASEMQFDGATPSAVRVLVNAIPEFDISHMTPGMPRIAHVKK